MSPLTISSFPLPELPATPSKKRGLEESSNFSLETCSLIFQMGVSTKKISTKFPKTKKFLRKPLVVQTPHCQIPRNFGSSNLIDLDLTQFFQKALKIERVAQDTKEEDDDEAAVSF